MHKNLLRPWRHACAALLCLLGSGGALHAADAAATLPAPVAAALTRAGVPQNALAAMVVPVDAGAPRLSWRADEPVNPASLMKLTTTLAALELLGPAYTWNTPVYVSGPVRNGTLQGDLLVRGSGDPTLVMERLWLLLRRVQARGIHTIAGDIVVDNAAWAPPLTDPGAFDGEPLRPYNASPEAFLVNFKALTLEFVPDEAAGLARIQTSPPLAGLAVQATLPLAPAGTACGDWRTRARLNLGDPARLAFDGSYPLACGERNWSMAPPAPETFGARAVAGMWLALGGRLNGSARLGTVPANLAPLLVHRSASLAEAVQSVNKYSNNVMAQQLFLTLGREAGGAGTPQAARAALQAWWERRMGGATAPVVDNGAGLSREGRIRPDAMARMLQRGWSSAVMPEFMGSLPIVGVDGTLRRSQSRAAGSAHLKTGSLRDVLGVAGYVLGADGRRWVLVAIVNHEQAGAARPALDALIDWVAFGAQP